MSHQTDLCSGHSESSGDRCFHALREIRRELAMASSRLQAFAPNQTIETLIQLSFETAQQIVEDAMYDAYGRPANQRLTQGSPNEDAFQYFDDKERFQMDLSKRQSSGYLRNEDLNLPYQWVMVEDVAMGAGFQEDTSKPARDQVLVKFKQYEQRLGLNRTNEGIMVKLLGPETDKWAGKVVLLYRTLVSFQGDMVPAVRIAGHDGHLMSGMPVDEAQRPCQFDTGKMPPAAEQALRNSGQPEKTAQAVSEVDDIPF